MRSTWPRLLVPLALAACGDVTNNHTFNDAGPHDATAPDAAPDAAVPGVVQITVYDQNGNLAVGSPVLFLDATDHVVADVVTDASGLAKATMLAGGSVTATMPAVLALAPRATPTANANLFTFEGVKPGDQLQIGSPRYVQGVLTSTTVTLPRFASAATYQINTYCGGIGFPQPTATGVVSGVLQIDPMCPTPGVEVEAIDGTGNVVASFVKRDLTPTAPTLDLSAESFVAVHQVTINATNLPASVNSVFTNAQQFFGGFSFYYPNADLAIMGTTATGVENFETAGSNVLERFYVDRLNGEQGFIRVAPEPTGSETVDVGAHLIPWVLSRPAYDVDHNTYDWVEAGGGTASGVTGTVTVTTPAGVSYTWSFVVPYTPGKLHLPTLTGSFAPFVIDPSYTVVGFLNLESWPGTTWDVRRAHAFSEYYGYSITRAAGATPDPNAWVIRSTYAGQ
jgi:hypothetical protein